MDFGENLAGINFQGPGVVVGNVDDELVLHQMGVQVPQMRRDVQIFNGGEPAGFAVE